MTTEPSDSDTPQRIFAFFSYWRTRLHFVRALDPIANSHEANVLLWAALDALGNLWAKRVRLGHVASSDKRRIFDGFLARYGGDPFQRVALPDIWHRATLPDTDLPSGARAFCKTVNREASTPLNRHLREISDDPELPALLSLLVANCELETQKPLLVWLARSRYGSIAYKRMRNSFIHEGRAGQGTHSFALHDSSTRPTYLSMKNDTPAVLGFSTACMADVLQRCIENFEREALALNQDPVPRR